MMNLDDSIIDGPLRIGIGKFTTLEEIEKSADVTARVFKQIVENNSGY